jgi:hypothetical protein
MATRPPAEVLIGKFDILAKANNFVSGLPKSFKNASGNLEDSLGFTGCGALWTHVSESPL